MADEYMEYLKHAIREQTELKVPSEEHHPNDVGPHMSSGRKEGMCPNPACSMNTKKIKVPEGQSTEETSCNQCGFVLSGTKHKSDPWSD